MDFGTADLNEARFVRADLRHVQMNDGTTMRGTDFSNALIVDLYLDGATLDHAITDGADISGVQHEPPRPPAPPAPILFHPPDLSPPSGELLDDTSKPRSVQQTCSETRWSSPAFRAVTWSVSARPRKARL